MTERLHAYIREAVDAAQGRLTLPGQLVSITDRAGRRLTLLVCPLRPAQRMFHAEGPCAIIFISEAGAAVRTLGKILSAQYGLTQAEARLVSALAAGETLAEYANARTLSLNTVKTHLKSIFDKTGHKRQSELIRDVLSNPIIRLAANE